MEVRTGMYAILDQPGVLRRLFHPRPEAGFRPPDKNRTDFMIPVDAKVAVSASLHLDQPDCPLILYFHGNGEIAADYDEIGPLFNRSGLNFWVTDYRGYGRSTGMPSVSSMMADSHRLFDFVREYRSKTGLTGPLCLMGRSLGSAPAIELAQTRPDACDCLIVESGFARISPLLEKLGIDPDTIGFKAVEGSENLDKIQKVVLPCLIIHAEQDHIIPFSDGMALHEACGSKRKSLLEIKGANHNDLFFRDMGRYLDHVRRICASSGRQNG